MRLVADVPEGGAPVVGRDNIMRQYRDVWDTWDRTDNVELLSEPRTIGDRVVVRTSWPVAGKGPAMTWS